MLHNRIRTNVEFEVKEEPIPGWGYRISRVEISEESNFEDISFNDVEGGIELEE